MKAELRNKTYELFDAALYSAGIRKRHRDRYIDRGDGLLALIHPIDRAPKALLLNRVIPALSNLLADHNASLPHPSRLQRQLRVRVVTHVGDVRYDANGCFGETLDVAFRLLDAAPVKRALRETANPLVLVISGDIYSSVVRHSYDGIDQRAFHPLVRIQIAGRRYPGWIHIPGTSDAAHYPDHRLPAPLHSRQQIRFTVASRPADASKAPVIYSSIHSNSARRTERPVPERGGLVGIKPKIVHIGGSRSLVESRRVTAARWSDRCRAASPSG